ncbi:gda1 cd39 (nucleoside phosphatase) family protein [Cystoisospora suis]|uniref:Gda1 cd39 (Nucleoside phosphatase) family protein n=1 Tax=Cystoisospora suis TaxID=483139 RepID=A0A2C6L0D3_9APIC|nr:gda1 cd39 (nucleoside phosphatase) family protein [Cystoisospora suis]
METESCPRFGRRVLPDTIRLVASGTRHAGLREVLERWLDKYAGKDWESRHVDSRILLKFFPKMEQAAKDFVVILENNIVTLMEEKLTEAQKKHVKAVGVPVVFYSTAGVRDFHDWYRDGFFIAIRAAINQPTNTKGYKLFTNPEMTRPITGAEEGLYAFLTLNHLTKRLSEDSVFCSRGADGTRRCRNDLAGVVEVGGASAQLVFPVDDSDILPSFVKPVNLQAERLLPESYPIAGVVSVSFMQLGVASSAGLFLKQLCSTEQFLRDGVCYNPCFFEGYEQPCSAGEVTIDKNGKASVSEDIRKNRLKPIGTYCSQNNPEIGMKATNELQCRANGIDPQQPLQKRLEFSNCSKIVGTGDFETCHAQIERLLISPRLPLPANIEAASSGFESVGHVFSFASSRSPMVITGGAMVASIRLLQKVELLSSPFEGNASELERAAKTFCSSPIVRDGAGAVIEVGKHQVKLDALNHDICKTMAVNVSLLEHMETADKRPTSITWEKSVVDDDGREVADLGWQVGAVLQLVLDPGRWSRMAYQTGWAHNL